MRRALERVAGGSYGSCLHGGGKVPEGRLEIMPKSCLCVACAARSS